MFDRELPEIKHYGLMLDDFASQFTLANETAGDYPSQSQIDHALDEMYALKDRLGRAISEQWLGDLEEPHSFIRLQRHEHEVLSAVLDELAKSGVEIPENYQTAEVVALSRDSGQHADDIAIWLLELPASDLQLKAAAIKYELDAVATSEQLQWQELDGVLAEANALVGRMMSVIGELENLQARLDEQEYRRESLWAGDYDDEFGLGDENDDDEGDD